MTLREHCQYGIIVLVLAFSINCSAENYRTLQKLLAAPNSTYQISASYDLGGKTIYIPKNCILNFVGGSIRNGNVVYDNTLICGQCHIECSCSGELANIVVTPQMYGALGDGKHDDTKAFEMLDGLDAYVPAGQYIITHVEFTKPTSIKGAGTTKSVIQQKPESGNDLLVYRNPTGSILEHVCLQGNSNDKNIQGEYQSLLKLYSTAGSISGYGCSFNHILIKKAPATGMVLLGSGSSDKMIVEKTKGLWGFSMSDINILECGKWGMIDESSDNRFSNFYISACGYGGMLCHSGSNLYSNFKIDGGTMGKAGKEAGYETGALLIVQNASNLQFSNFDIQSAYYCGIKMYKCNNIRFSGDVNNCGLGTSEGTAVKLKNVRFSQFDANLFNMNYKQKYGFVLESDCRDVDVKVYNKDSAININKADRSCKVESR